MAKYPALPPGLSVFTLAQAKLNPRSLSARSLYMDTLKQHQ